MLLTNTVQNDMSHESAYLHDAVTAVLAGKEVPVDRARTLGCTIHVPPLDDIEQVTYASHIARILQDNCQSRHRQGQVGPFSLANYEEASTWASEIKAYPHSRLMPPWKAVGWGEKTTDEMCIAFFTYLKAADDAPVVEPEAVADGR